jgi:hypothetical protein
MKHFTSMIPIIVVTPFCGDEDILISLKENLFKQLSTNDKWVIVYDHVLPKKLPQIQDENIIVLENNLNPGAGNARNLALDYIEKNYDFPYLLYPIDSDDQILPNSIFKIRQAFSNYSEKIITFGHIKAWAKKEVHIGYEGIYDLESLLKKYITPCGSTIVKITRPNDIKELRFGHRKRANDQLFFLNAVKKFKHLRSIADPILLYRITNSNSVSSKKYKMILYKYLALRDFGINRYVSIYYMFYFIFFGMMRHIFKIGV